jgi:hypothetical protein
MRELWANQVTMFEKYFHGTEKRAHYPLITEDMDVYCQPYAAMSSTAHRK